MPTLTVIIDNALSWEDNFPYDGEAPYQDRVFSLLGKAVTWTTTQGKAYKPKTGVIRGFIPCGFSLVKAYPFIKKLQAVQINPLGIYPNSNDPKRRTTVSRFNRFLIEVPRINQQTKRYMESAFYSPSITMDYEVIGDGTIFAEHLTNIQSLFNQ